MAQYDSHQPQYLSMICVRFLVGKFSAKIFLDVNFKFRVESIYFWSGKNEKSRS